MEVARATEVPGFRPVEMSYVAACPRYVAPSSQTTHG